MAVYTLEYTKANGYSGFSTTKTWLNYSPIHYAVLQRIWSLMSGTSRVGVADTHINLMFTAVVKN